jgi:hypothetical protein
MEDEAYLQNHFMTNLKKTGVFYGANLAKTPNKQGIKAEIKIFSIRIFINLFAYKYHFQNTQSH